MALLSMSRAPSSMPYPTDVHSLCLEYTVRPQSTPGQPWGQMQALVDTMPLFQYDSDSSMVKPLSPLGEKANAIKGLTELTQTLREVMKELRMILPNMELEENKTGGPPTLQVKVFCQREAERCTGASWQLSINGQTTLLFDAMNMNWTVVNTEARGTKEEWEDRGLAEDLRKLSTGDCNHWLRELLEHWETMPEQTVPRVKIPDAPQSSSTTLIASISVFFPVLIAFGLFM
ncbi:retinoic acid early transcript 1E [Nycticebus coucang]|uniref:retinoic acid early transcript 1E n=1 Tax=Nycticebus coucang TaxID=9470 RepID=UPI00234DF56C|nr:retinoic acid early transcript 1E [Nycticebus coucang]